MHWSVSGGRKNLDESTDDCNISAMFQSRAFSSRSGHEFIFQPYSHVLGYLEFPCTYQIWAPISSVSYEQIFFAYSSVHLPIICSKMDQLVPGRDFTDGPCLENESSAVHTDLRSQVNLSLTCCWYFSLSPVEIPVRFPRSVGCSWVPALLLEPPIRRPLLPTTYDNPINRPLNLLHASLHNIHLLPRIFLQ